MPGEAGTRVRSVCGLSGGRWVVAVIQFFTLR
jgi:hypothetical protein